MFKKVKGTHSMLGSLVLCGIALTFLILGITTAKNFVGYSGDALGIKTQNKFHTTSSKVPETFSDVETEVRNPY